MSGAPKQSQNFSERRTVQESGLKALNALGFGFRVQGVGVLGFADLGLALWCQSRRASVVGTECIPGIGRFKTASLPRGLFFFWSKERRPRKQESLL